MDIRTKSVKFDIVDMSKEELLDTYSVLIELEEEGKNIGHATELRKAIEDWADFFDVDLSKARKKKLIGEIPF